MHILKKLYLKLIFSLLSAVKNIRSGTTFFLIYINGHYAQVKIWMFSLHKMKIFMVFTEKE